MRCSIVFTALVAAVSSVVAAPLVTSLSSRYAALASVSDLAPLSKRNCNGSQMPSSIDMNVVRGIYKAVRARTSDRKVLVVTYATCLTESFCNDLPCGDQESHGPFQQKGPGMGWGTVEDTMNIPVTTNNFLNALFNIYTGGNKDLPVNVLAQKVQLAEAGDQYARSIDKANQLADQMIAENGGGDNNNNNDGNNDSSSSSPKPTKTKTTDKPTSTSTKSSGSGGAINVGGDPNADPAPTASPNTSGGDNGSNDDGDCDSSAPPCDKFYIPVPGDNCYKVSDMFNLSLDQFYKLNADLDNDCQNLYAGQKYCVAASDV